MAAMAAVLLNSIFLFNEVSATVARCTTHAEYVAVTNQRAQKLR